MWTWRRARLAGRGHGLSGLSAQSVRFGQIGLQADGALITLDRLGEAGLRVQTTSQFHVHLRIFGRQLRGLLERALGLGYRPLTLKHDAKRRVRRSKSRVD